MQSETIKKKNTDCVPEITLCVSLNFTQQLIDESSVMDVLCLP